MTGLSLCSADLHFVTYFILYSWDNKDSLTNISVCLYTSHSRLIAAATADPPYTNQQII